MANIRDLTMFEVVREQIARGEITAITFWKQDGRWQANARRPDGAWAVAFHDDPFVALLEAVSPSVLQPKTDSFEDLLG
ncbi:MAG: hypothetical protein DI537_20285 [Stutzerimonas stutzeri]|nr:MAG: hypothetical protein DI537_20285 [Stutzerimonas stutzeri]